MPSAAEFYGLHGFADPGPRHFVPAHGPRKLNMAQTVKVAQIEYASDHQVKMSEFAARAVKWFGEQKLEVQWHTLQFEVLRTGMEDELEYVWRWSVWAS